LAECGVKENEVDAHVFEIAATEEKSRLDFVKQEFPRLYEALSKLFLEKGWRV
jgi:hypothetical protein